MSASLEYFAFFLFGTFFTLSWIPLILASCSDPSRHTKYQHILSFCILGQVLSLPTLRDQHLWVEHFTVQQIDETACEMSRILYYGIFEPIVYVFTVLLILQQKRELRMVFNDESGESSCGHKFLLVVLVLLVIGNLGVQLMSKVDTTGRACRMDFMTLGVETILTLAFVTLYFILSRGLKKTGGNIKLWDRRISKSKYLVPILLLTSSLVVLYNTNSEVNSDLFFTLRSIAYVCTCLANLLLVFTWIWRPTQLWKAINEMGMDEDYESHHETEPEDEETDSVAPVVEEVENRRISYIQRNDEHEFIYPTEGKAMKTGESFERNRIELENNELDDHVSEESSVQLTTLDGFDNVVIN